jgi:hypothetical protein
MTAKNSPSPRGLSESDVLTSSPPTQSPETSPEEKEKPPQIKVGASHGTPLVPALASLVIQSKQPLHLVKK